VKDLTGQRFGKLTVKCYNDTVRGSVRRWICLCDCGKLSIMEGASLTRKKGNSTSCGCLKRERIGSFKRLSPGLAARNKCIRQYKSRAKRAGISFDLSDEEFFSLTQQNCHYCGIEPYRTSVTKGFRGVGDFVYNGVDRVDSKLGYCVSNCVPCCRFCNMGKVDMPYDEFIAHLNQIVKFRRDLC
jgi:hypothetical protein